MMICRRTTARIMISASILLSISLSFAAIAGAVSVKFQEMPLFGSAISAELGAPVDFLVLYERANSTYEVIDHDPGRIVWRFAGTTGDWAIVSADGRLIVASTVDLDLAAKDILEKELNLVMDLLNSVEGGISAESRENAIDYAIYYASDAGIYHRIRYSFSGDFDLSLRVPDWVLMKAKFSVLGSDRDAIDGRSGQHHLLDGRHLTGCDATYGESCSVPSQDVTLWIGPGVHEIEAIQIDDPHQMIIEAITAPSEKGMVLYDDEIWVEERSRPLSITELEGLTRSCGPLTVEVISPKEGFRVDRAMPVKLEVQVNNLCGDGAEGAWVAARFGNDDTGLLLDDLGEGLYAGTWIPWNRRACNLTVIATPGAFGDANSEAYFAVVNGTVR